MTLLTFEDVLAIAAKSNASGLKPSEEIESLGVEESAVTRVAQEMVTPAVVLADRDVPLDVLLMGSTISGFALGLLAAKEIQDREAAAA